MLTAKGQECDQQQGREVGANLYMTKPFDPDEVLDKATEILAIAPPNDSATVHSPFMHSGY